MIYGYLVVEGPTEEAFVKIVLKPHLDAQGVYVTPIIVKTRIGEDGVTAQGGTVKWSVFRKELRSLLGNPSPDVRVTTMFDLFRLPTDFPGVKEHAAVDTARRVALIEAALADDIADPRFLPYIQRHEFEALVLASIEQLGEIIDPNERPGWKDLRKEVKGRPPEDVNDGVNTAPSKRLTRHIPGYAKVVHGPMAIQRAGLAALRAACPRFDAWLTRLESLATTPAASTDGMP